MTTNPNGDGTAQELKAEATRKAQELMEDAARKGFELKAEAARKARELKAEATRKGQELKAEAARKAGETARKARELKEEAARKTAAAYVAASNRQLLATWQDARAHGMLKGMMRVWLGTADEFTCPVCRYLDRQTVPFDAPFVTEDGRELMSPPACPLCRCSMGLTEY